MRITKSKVFFFLGITLIALLAPASVDLLAFFLLLLVVFALKAAI
jgi:hypothetical protein